jgi:hypothetical protein
VKIYVMTTGVVFGLLVLFHIWRAVEEGPTLLRNPWYMFITIAAGGLCLWAGRLVWRSPRS